MQYTNWNDPFIAQHAINVLVNKVNYNMMLFNNSLNQL